MILIRIILLPFSLIYSAIMYIRNKLYDTGLFKSYSISKPVISVGNITTGGTGKTPLVILIADYFLSKGIKTGIISRGYKRKSQTPVLVSDGITINENADETGDELLLIAEELIKNYSGNFFIAADSDRVRAAEFLIKNYDPDIIILDDGFQNRRIKRDLDVVLIDHKSYTKNRFLHSFTLPAGILRESMNNLKRADLLIQNNKSEDVKLLSELKQYGKEILIMRYKSEYFMDYKNSILKKEDAGAVIFSGIADDESFIQMIKSRGIKIREIMKFSDHHIYTDAEIGFLIKRYSEDIIFITTEKDFVKIKLFKDFVTKYPVYFLKMNAEMDNDSSTLYSKLDALIK